MILIRKESKTALKIYIDKQGCNELLKYLNDDNRNVLKIDDESIGLNNKNISYLKIELLQDQNIEHNGFIEQQNGILKFEFLNEEKNDPDDDSFIEYLIYRLEQYLETNVFNPAEFIDLCIKVNRQNVSLYFIDYNQYTQSAKPGLS